MSTPVRNGPLPPIALAASTERSTRRALIAAPAVGAASAVIYWTNAALGLPVEQLDHAGEGTFLSWLSVVGAAFGAAFAAAHALWIQQMRGAVLIVALGIAFLSLDEAIEIHERVGDRVVPLLPGVLAHDDAVQFVLIGPVLLAVAGGLVALARRTTPTARRTLLVGLAYLGAAVLLELVLATLIPSSGEADRGLGVVARRGVEEAVELAGWVTIAFGLAGTLAASLILRTTAELGAGDGHQKGP